MLPLMFAARKLDGEDPNIVFMLRCSYGAIQAMIVLAVLYIYMVAKKISTSSLKDVEIFVPPPPQPLADPNAKPQYTRTTLGEHATSAASKLLGSTLFGICMTLGLHYYKGMIIGIAMQTVMGPLNLFENTLAKSILLGGGLKSGGEDGEDPTASFKKRRMFGEKYREELSDKDDIVDSDGAKVVLKKEKGTLGSGKSKKDKSKSFEELLLDTWDGGHTADIGPLVKALKKDNMNYKTKESGWTPLMIFAAIGAEGSKDAIKKMKSLGASATLTDKEGWNALHWAAFHGSASGAMALMDAFDGMKLGLHLVKDLEGMTPLDHAVKEKNDDVASFIKSKIEVAIGKGTEEAGIADQSGLRKRN